MSSNIANLERQLKVLSKAIEEAQDNNELARLDNELEELKLLKIQMEIDDES